MEAAYGLLKRHKTKYLDLNITAVKASKPALVNQLMLTSVYAFYMTQTPVHFEALSCCISEIFPLRVLRLSGQ
jgi:hypothetical protein